MIDMPTGKDYTDTMLSGNGKQCIYAGSLRNEASPLSNTSFREGRRVGNVSRPFSFSGRNNRFSPTGPHIVVLVHYPAKTCIGLNKRHEGLSSSARPDEYRNQQKHNPPTSETIAKIGYHNSGDIAKDLLKNLVH